MADFLLSVGVDVGLSYDQMQKDISNLVSQLNSNPPKIKVGLDIDSAAIANFRTQVAEITRSLGGNGMGGMAAQVREAAAATQSAAAGIKNTSSATSVLARNTTEYHSALKQVNTLLTQVTNSQNKWTAASTGKSSEAYKDLGVYNDRLNQLKAQLLTGQMSAKDFRLEMSRIRDGVASASQSIKGAGEATLTWSQRMGTLSAKFGTWFSITRVIMAAYRAVRQMVTNVVELDTAMTELRKVTNETDATYERFLVRATSRAKKLGAALTDTVNATADFARLGFGIEDAEKLADAAIVYKNVGDGIEDIGTASESIIATMQAFGIPAEKVMTIVDRFNEVGNNFAISSKGVGDALLRSAAALHAANNTIDESIALAAAANTIVQDPEKVGTTLKTVSMYLRAAKTEAEEAGEATDGMASSMSELRKDILKLTGHKVDIQLNENTFKSTYQILKELSVVWHELTDLTQANILEMVGGKRNSNVVAALLENFTVAEKALETSADSAGSALAENEKVLESVQGKLSVFKATFESMSQNLIDENFVKSVIELGTSLLNILDAIAKVINALGGLNTVLYSTIAIFTILKADVIGTAVIGGFTKLTGAISSLIGFFTKLRSAMAVYKTMTAATKNASAGALVVYGQSTSVLGRLSAAFKAVGISASAAQLAMGAIVAALTVVIGTVNAVKNAQEKAAAAAEENYNKIIDKSKELSQTQKQLKDLVNQYRELGELNDGAWTSENLTQIESIQSSITDLVGRQAEGIDLVNGKLDDEYAKLLNILKLTSDDAYDTAKSEYSAAQQKFDKGFKNDTNWHGSSEESDQLAGWYITKAYEQTKGVSQDDAQLWWGKQSGHNAKWLGDVPTALDDIGDYEEGLKKLKEWRDIILDAEDQEKGFGYMGSDFWTGAEKWVEYDTSDAITFINSKIDEFEKVIDNVEDSKQRFYEAQANKEVLDYLTQTGIGSQKEFTEWINKVMNDSTIEKDYAESLINTMHSFLPAFKIPDDIKRQFIADRDALIQEITTKIPEADGSVVGDWLDSLDNSEYQSFSDWWKENNDSEAVTSSLQDMQNAFINYRNILATVPDALSDIPSTVDYIDNLSESLVTVANLQKEVADGFTMSIERALEFASVYPEILKGASATANGQITLNRDVVNSFIQAKKAELDAELDAKILALEADKALLEAKRAAAEAQLELAKSVGEGEGEISADVAGYRIGVSNVLTQALIDNGIDEATAFRLAAATMSGNADEFNRIVAECAGDIDENLINAFWNAAQSSYDNSKSMKDNIAAVTTQAHELAKAIAAAGEGEIAGTDAIVDGGSGGTLKRPITLETYEGNFEGEGYTYEHKSFNIDDYIADIELDIAKYTDKIAEIDGQIAILQAMKNAPITEFSSDKKDFADKKEKEVEEYIASVERYTEALQKLRDAEIKQAKLERDLSNADTALEKVGIQKELIDAYKERQQALHELNNLRDTTINNAIPELQALGFQIEYNADTNRLYIANLEHLNELQAESAGEYESVQEATNALRKDTEKLIDDITGLNEENQDGSETWLDLADSINESKENIVELLNEVVSEAVDFVSAMQDVYETLKEAAGEYAETGALSVDTLKAIAEYGAEYMNYLKDENGMLSINKERIEAVIAARTKQLAVDTAMSYVEKIRYALSENNIKELNRLITATEQASDATWGLVYSNLALLDLDESQYTQALANINRLRSLANNAVESIKLGTDESNKGYEDMQDALDKILDLTMELVEYEVNQEIEALEEQKEKYREIIDLKKEALDETKKENDYNKEVAKKVAEIAKLQDKINKLSLDDSREAQAEKAALEQELAELQTDLSDYQTDYSVDKQQEMLDEMADSYEEEKDKEIAILEDSISSTEKIYQLAIDRINNDWDNLYDDIIDWNYEAGSSIESEIVAAWELASKAVQEYGSYIEATNKLAAGVTSGGVDLGASGNYGDPKAIINQMRNNSLQWFTASDSEQSRLSSANKTLASQLSSIYEQDVTSKNGAWYLDGETDPLYSIGKWEAVDFITKAMKNNSAKWSGASPSERAELEKANEKMAKYIADLSGQKVWKDSDGVWWIDNAKLYESYGTYHTGGVVGDSTLKKDEVMAILKDGELVLDEKREEGLYKLVDFAQILSERLGTTIDTSKFDNLFGGFSLLPTSRDLLPAAHGGSALTEFSPHIEVNISHNGSMSDDDARRYGGLIAETALGELKDAFTKKGITSLGNSALK